MALGHVAPRGIVRVACPALGRHWIAVGVELVIGTLDAIRQQQVLLASERRRSPVEYSEQLLDALGAGLPEHRPGAITGTQEENRLCAIVRREVPQESERLRRIQPAPLLV